MMFRVPASGLRFDSIPPVAIFDTCRCEEEDRNWSRFAAFMRGLFTGQQQLNKSG